jgi:hypothetical protein
MNTHPLLGTGPEWTVTNYMATVELKHADGRVACIPKPYERMPASWWMDKASVAIAEAGKPVVCSHRLVPTASGNGRRCVDCFTSFVTLND